MLEQIVYTRCSPHRDLKNKGQTLRTDGFGVFSMSPGIIANTRQLNYDFLQARLAIKNGSLERGDTGLFNSYEYIAAAPQVYALTFEFSRPSTRTTRVNGKTHRDGDYIKQCLVGSLQDYPARWFGAPVWDAHKKPQNDYYLLDTDPHAVPELLPQVQDTCGGGYVTRDRVREFVQDGRSDAVKAAVWFLLQEFGKPEGERKVLLIRDIPENVELWIGAVEYGFSAELARQIPFHTNISKLSGNPDSQLFYYTDDTGRYSPMVNRSVHQTRHPYYMIAGFHPKDRLCSTLKQMPVSSFVILDGTAKTIGVQPDAAVNRPYYESLVRYDEDMQDFCSVVLPALPRQELSEKLPELFDAYRYLLDSGHKADKWNYAAALRWLGVLLPEGAFGNAALNGYLLGECLQAYPHFASIDEGKGYPLLQYMGRLAGATGRQREVTGCIADVVSGELNSLSRNGGRLAATWRALNAGHAAELLQPALRDLFNDTELPGYTAQLRNCEAADAQALLEMFLQMLRAEGIGLETVRSSRERYMLVCTVVMAVFAAEPNRTPGVLRRLQAEPELVSSIAANVAQLLEKNDPARAMLWWDMVLDACGGSVSALCKSLCASKSVSMDTVEQLLAGRVERAGRLDADISKAFTETAAALGRTPRTGSWIFGTWIRTAQPRDFGNIIRSVKKCRLEPQAERELFRQLDAALPPDAPRDMDPAVYRELEQWAQELKEVSRSAALHAFQKSFAKTRRAEEAVELVHALADYQLVLDDGFLRSGYFKDMATIAAEYFDAELHMAILCLFRNAAGVTADSCAEKYTAEILAATKARDLVPQLVSLCEASMYRFKSTGRDGLFAGEVQKALEAALARQLPEYYRGNLADQVERYTECEEAVKNKLIPMIGNAGAGHGKGTGGLNDILGNLGGGLGGLFGRKR